MRELKPTISTFDNQACKELHRELLENSKTIETIENLIKIDINTVKKEIRVLFREICNELLNDTVDDTSSDFIEALRSLDFQLPGVNNKIVFVLSSMGYDCDDGDAVCCAFYTKGPDVHLMKHMWPCANAYTFGLTLPGQTGSLNNIISEISSYHKLRKDVATVTKRNGGLEIDSTRLRNTLDFINKSTTESFVKTTLEELKEISSILNSDKESIRQAIKDLFHKKPEETTEITEQEVTPTPTQEKSETQNKVESSLPKLTKWLKKLFLIKD